MSTKPFDRTIVHALAIRTLASIEPREHRALRPRLEAAFASLHRAGDIVGVNALGRLVHAIDDEASLHAAGRAVMARTLHRLVGQRLLLGRSLREAAPRHARPPIVIVGLPRTGTTFLHQRLGDALRVRTLRYWETMEPGHLRGRVPERALVAKHALSLASLRLVDPEVMRMHDVHATSPEECGGLLKVSFATEQFFATLHVPSYLEWVSSIDSRDTYRAHAAMLHAIAPRPAGRWLLKSPFHLFGLEALRTIHPGVRFIVTTRDASRALASRIALVHRLRGLLADVDVTALARDVVEWTKRASAMSTPILEAMSDERCTTISAERLFADTPREVDRLVEWIGR